jgi:hypothetical protein
MGLEARWRGLENFWRLKAKQMNRRGYPPFEDL